ncbi:MAG: cupin domain-containing protein [SAR324 cluster bacterium]|nr:cupin domain-containing protein [SAR324 cluster bacterium]
MPFFKWKELESELVTPRYSPARGPAVQGEKMMMGRFSYPAGGVAKAHSHPNEQIVSMLKGKARVRIGDEERILGPGEVYFIPANVEHETETLEDREVIVCKNIVPKWSIKEAKWDD